jgi:hypothetical protein
MLMKQIGKSFVMMATMSCFVASAGTTAQKLDATDIAIRTLQPIPLREPVGTAIRCEVFAPVYQGRTLVIPERAPCTLKTTPIPARFSDPRYAAAVQLDTVTIGNRVYPLRSSQKVIVPRPKGWTTVFDLMSDVDLNR